MDYIESATVELKRILVDDVKKEVLAFSNSDGGTIYIGIADNGEIVGVSDPNEVVLQVNNMLRDSIKPDIMLFVRCHAEMADGKAIVVIDVQRGTERPYYLSGKGIRPEGVYVRQGTASVPATDTAIRRMIRETDGESYEELRSLNQELTFESAKAEFARRNTEFGTPQMMTLGLLNSDGLYTNLGMLLSDQCVHTIKAAVFQDETQQAFKDRREFAGSLFKQLNDVYDFVDSRNQLNSTFDKLLRIDKRDYPENAIREALLNAIVHREYSLGGSILVKMFSDRIEFISVGGLIRGIELADIMSGYSICRNPLLAGVFYRLQLIEAYGTGMLKIFEAYAGSGTEPKVEVTPNTFKIILPNRNEKPAESVRTGHTHEALILNLINERGIIERRDVEELLGIAQTHAGQLLRALVASGRVVKEGNGRTTKYRINARLH